MTLQVEQYPHYFQAITNNRAIAADDARNDPRTSEFTKEYLIPLQISSMLDAAIRREGQVIGVVDTGINIDSCFFFDEDNGQPALNDSQGTEVDLVQRKVIAVDFYWDWPDPEPTAWDDPTPRTGS